MATTVVTDYTAREVRTYDDGSLAFDGVEFVAHLQDVLERAQGDSDKAGEVEAVCYYDGIVDALTGVLETLTIEPDDDEEA